MIIIILDVNTKIGALNRQKDKKQVSSPSPLIKEIIGNMGGEIV